MYFAAQRSEQERKNQFDDRKLIQDLLERDLRQLCTYYAYKIVAFLDLFHMVALHHVVFYFEGVGSHLELVDARIFDCDMGETLALHETMAERRARFNLSKEKQNRLTSVMEAPDREKQEALKRECEEDEVKAQIYKAMKSSLQRSFEDIKAQIHQKKQSRVQLDQCQAVFQELLPELPVKLNDIVMDQHMNFDWAVKKAMCPDKVIKALNPALGKRARKIHFDRSSWSVHNRAGRNQSVDSKGSSESLDTALKEQKTLNRSYDRFKRTIYDRKILSNPLMKDISEAQDRVVSGFNPKGSLDQTQTRNKRLPATSQRKRTAMPLLRGKGFNSKSSVTFTTDEDSVTQQVVRPRTLENSGRQSRLR